MTGNNKEQLVVYGADWCGDCRRAKRFLDEKQVTYTWMDLEKNPDEMHNMQKYNGGVQSIPTIVFPDGRVLIEPSNRELAQQLGL
jgi:mycoredoxin